MASGCESAVTCLKTISDGLSIMACRKSASKRLLGCSKQAFGVKAMLGDVIKPAEVQGQAVGVKATLGDVTKPAEVQGPKRSPLLASRAGVD